MFCSLYSVSGVFVLQSLQFFLGMQTHISEMQLSQIPLYVRALLKYCFIVVTFVRLFTLTFTVQFRLQSVCDLWHLCQLSVYTNELQFC